MKRLFCISISLIVFASSQSQTHPSIMLTKQNVEAVRKGITVYPLLKQSFAETKKTADDAVANPINVPTPKDGGGGFTHEQHKRNYQNILACGVAYQITQDAKYAKYVQNILLEYAKQYNTWPLHPKRKQGQESGRIFWQNLNDCVWQVYVIQGYDLVYNAISIDKRKIIEEDLFKPIVKFLTVDATATFNRIHNHATWSCAAVGMTGYVLGNKEWSEMALKGSAKDGKTGFLKQLNELFSPDGYYTEGPYYQRYALLPFVVFAKAINQYQPELKIFETRNGILSKAIQTALQLTYTNGAFFPINDAMKDKTYESEELVYGVDIAYADIKQEADLLDVAGKQKRVIISDAGLKVAIAVAAKKATPFEYKSLFVNDGTKGDEGGLAVLRSGKNEDQQCVLLKASAQGMGHGHFDRLNVLYYDNNVEVFSDYGAARFLNIESKRGGDYLPENNAYAKQTIAHNTMVVDETSQYNGKVSDGEKFHPELLYFNAGKEIKVASAKENNAYKDVALTRTVALISIDGLEKPLLVDVFKATSNKVHQYDLPFWYQGQLTNIPFAVDANTKQQKQLGKANGYQFLWLNGTANSQNDSSNFLTILNNKRFYTTSFAADTNTTVKFVTIGANDPEFSLRNEKAFILSHNNTANQTFICVTEAHGNTNPIAETTTESFTHVSNIKIIKDDEKQTVFEFQVKNKKYTIHINYTETNNFIQLEK